MNHNMTKNSKENRTQNQTGTEAPETRQSHTGSSQNKADRNTGY